MFFILFPVSAGPSLNTNRSTHEQDDQENIRIFTDLPRASDTR